MSDVVISLPWEHRINKTEFFLDLSKFDTTFHWFGSKLLRSYGYDKTRSLALEALAIPSYLSSEVLEYYQCVLLKRWFTRPLVLYSRLMPIPHGSHVLPPACTASVYELIPERYITARAWSCVWHIVYCLLQRRIIQRISWPNIITHTVSALQLDLVLILLTGQVTHTYSVRLAVG